MPSIEEILVQTLNSIVEQRHAPVPGAVLKSALLEKGAELPSGKFKDFLSHYTHIVTVISRSGQDILIIPRGGEHLLERKEGAQSSRIRYDFYKAFTTINPTQFAYYNKNIDFIEWKVQVIENDQNLVTIPPRTQAAEIALRNKFIESVDAPQREILSRSLATDWAISAFGKEIRRLNLLDQWFKFRIKDVVVQITEWATASGIDVKDSWISTDERVNVVSHQQTNELHLRPFLDGLKKLDATDISRITVPLDVVLKMLGR